jgi:general secretion pathway protein G
MTMRIFHRHRVKSRPGVKRQGTAGLTLIELTVTIGILLVLSTAAIPVAQMTIHRQREAELRRDLREMRDAIDRYKDAADKNLIRTEVGSQGYPPDLDTLVNGVDIAVGGNVGGISAAALAAASQNGGSIATAASDLPTKVRFLRRVPVDPMTGKSDWGLRSIQDDPDSHSWGGHNVFDVYTQSQGSAIDGTKYEDW